MQHQNGHSIINPSDKEFVWLHAAQFNIFNSPARFRILIAGRRFGKSELALAEIYRAAVMRPNQVCWYVTPVKNLAEDIAWVRLKEVTQPFWATSKSPRAVDESNHRISLANGSTISLKSAFNHDSLRGRGINFLVIDEFANVNPEAWRQVFRPALADRRGRALLMTTPKGRNHVFDFFEYAQTNPEEWAAFQFTTGDGGIVSGEELASASAELDANTFRQEFLGEFGTVGTYRVYPQFDRAIHLRNVTYDDAHPLIWSIDFNVDPMIMLIMQLISGNLHVIEELVLKPNANTRDACTLFHNRIQTFYYRLPFRQRPIPLRVYGDASGNQRRTAGTETDWNLIINSFNEWVGVYDVRFYPNKSNPLVRDRVNCVNARLMSQSGDARVFINPNCKELIRDLEEVSWDTDKTGRPTNELNKADRTRTHASDAMGYFIHELFPMKPTFGAKNIRLFW